MRDDKTVVAAGFHEGASVAELGLDGGDDTSLGHAADGERVADGESSLLSAVDVLSGVEPLGGDHGLHDASKPIWVAKFNARQWSPSSWVVDNLSDDTSDVSFALMEIEFAQLCFPLALVDV